MNNYHYYKDIHFYTDENLPKNANISRVITISADPMGYLECESEDVIDKEIKDIIYELTYQYEHFIDKCVYEHVTGSVLGFDVIYLYDDVDNNYTQLNFNL